MELQKKITDNDSNKIKIIKIDVVDLLILRNIADFMNRQNIVKYVIEDKTYFYVKYSTIMDDLPILNIKQQALSDRLNKLCLFGLLEKKVVKNQSGTYTAFRIGSKYEELIYDTQQSCTSTQTLLHKYSDTSANVANYKCNNIIKYNSSTINQSNNKKEIDKSISKKKENSFDFSGINSDFLPAIEKWLKYKSARRQQYKTQMSFNIMVNRLLKLSNYNAINANEIVDQSIANNYAGLFALKTKKTGMILNQDADVRNDLFKHEKGW